ncbi:MAG: hypothetical protein JNN30_17735 [Rhodanobacteraceae bacterium]|nr:hypothetical protein [Rhodanobacteraceae bacterium]
MTSLPQSPVDKNGQSVFVGSKVRVVGLSGGWLESLPEEEKADILSMVGEVFVVEEIDEYGQPWVRKSWPNEAEGTCHSHSVALEQHEMELADHGSI